MKRIQAAAALAAVVILSGCSAATDTSQGGSESMINVSGNEQAGQSSQGGNGDAPPLAASEFSDVTENNNFISSGEEFHIKDGEVFSIDDTLTVESGAKIIVDDGGALSVSGGIELSGDIELRDSGRLEMTSDGAYIEGDGNVIVTEDFDSIDCEIGTIKAHITPPERKMTDGVTTVGGIVIANKSVKLPPEFGSHLSLDEVEPEVSAALYEMNLNSNHLYQNKSGYRSYYDQQAIFQNYCEMYGYAEADTFSSQAGHSEHQTGLTMDLDSFEESYGYTAEGMWLAENCYKYGFIIRYPQGKEEITGYTYEPWHVRYLGKSNAKLVYDSGLTLEEFLNVEGGTTVID